MDDLITKFLSNFTQLHDAGLIALKTIISIGVFGLVAYLLTINYIPSEISFGDTLVFILIFSACSIAYAYLSMILFFFGILLIPLVCFIFNVVDKYLPPHIKIGEKLPFPKFSIIKLAISIYLLYALQGIFLLTWKINLYIGLTVCFIAFFNYPFYLNHQKIKAFYRKFDNLQEILNDEEASEPLKTFAHSKLKRLETHKNDRVQIAFGMVLIPLVPMFFIADIGKIFLNHTMQQVGVRVEKAVLYIKQPYANLIDLPKTTTKELAAYKIFVIKDAKVLFQGVGGNTLISYKVKNDEKQIIIPNDYITVELTNKVK